MIESRRILTWQAKLSYLCFRETGFSGEHVPEPEAFVNVHHAACDATLVGHGLHVEPVATQCGVHHDPSATIAKQASMADWLRQPQKAPNSPAVRAAGFKFEVVRCRPGSDRTNAREGHQMIPTWASLTTNLADKFHEGLPGGPRAFLLG